MVSGRSSSTRGIPHPPTHLPVAREPQKLALGSWPQSLDLGRRPSPNPPTAGRQAAEVCPWSLAAAPRPQSSSIPHPTHCRPPSCRSCRLSLAAAPRPGSSYIPQPTYCQPLRRSSLPLVPGRRASTRVFVHLPNHALASSGPAQERKEETAYHLEYRGPGPDCPPELWSPTSAHRPAPCGPRKRPQPLTVVRQPPTNGPAS